jgi:hypothetical protein
MNLNRIIKPLNDYSGGMIQPPSPKWNTDSGVNPDIAAQNLENIMSIVIGSITITAVLFFIVYFFIGGFKMATAGDSKDKFDKGKDQIIHGTLGLILIVASYSLIGLIGTLVGIDILDLATTITGLKEPL